jgi:outer membrane protein assembly factor BamB
MNDERPAGPADRAPLTTRAASAAPSSQPNGAGLGRRADSAHPDRRADSAHPDRRADSAHPDRRADSAHPDRRADSAHVGRRADSAHLGRRADSARLDRRADSARLGRRAALIAAAGALSGCSLWDTWFGENKPPLPGKREPVLASSHSLDVDPAERRPLVLPPATDNPAWPQPGGNPRHVMGNLADGPGLTRLWRADIGAGGGYRRALTAQPLVADGRVYTMDSDAAVSGFDLRTGARLWRQDTRAEDDRSTNVGGGITSQAGRVYAATGRGDLLAIDAATGRTLWRKTLAAPARSAPSWSDGLLYVVTLDGKVLALADKDGSLVWSYLAGNAPTSVLGQPAPAIADGLVVAGFGSGELACLRAPTGAVVWTDSLSAANGRTDIANVSAIHGMPVIDGGRVFAIGLGGLMLSLDLRAGRRLWQREIAGGETPWLAGGFLFLITADQLLVAADQQDGHLRWVTQLPRYANPEKQSDPIVWTGPLLAGGRLILASDNARLLTADPATGALGTPQELSGPVSVPPIAAGGTVLLVSDDGALLALR